MAWSLIVALIVLVAAYFFAYSSLPEQLHWQVMKATLESAVNECPGFAGLVRVESCTDVLGSTGYDFGGCGLDRVVIVQLDDDEHAQLGSTGDPKAANPGGWQEADDLADGWFPAPAVTQRRIPGRLQPGKQQQRASDEHGMGISVGRARAG